MIRLRLSLTWKIWLSTSVALTALFAVTGWFLQRHAFAATSRSLEEEVKASFQAYDSVWKARAENLGSLAAVLSGMPNLKAALGNRDTANIRGTAAELWQWIARKLLESAFFLVTDIEGTVIAGLERGAPSPLPQNWPVVPAVRARFPRQVSGFIVSKGELYQLALTPVYRDSEQGPALDNVLLAGYPVNHLVAQQLKESTGGSEFLFLGPGRVFASTLNDRATYVLSQQLASGKAAASLSDGVSEYAPLVRELVDLEDRPVGRLAILRSYEGAQQQINELRRVVILIWLCAMAAGLALTWMLARRIVLPVETLDRAASEVARGNYDYRVAVDSQDELGRLARTFNSMRASLQAARQELIRQERISTIGRMASSIIHDLRNPLAAIYGGSEMMVDADLPPQQMKRLAGNIYRSTRRIQEMLQELADVSRGKAGQTEICRLREIIEAAASALGPRADSQAVAIQIDVPETIEVAAERARLERVFENLMVNSLDAMPEGGESRITARADAQSVLIDVADTGPGLSPALRGQLFQPFVSYGKKGGLGLGLALSRQAVLDHGGDMWVGDSERGARICLLLPLAPGG